MATFLLENGRGTQTRTVGLRFWRPSLYQLSYTPTARSDYVRFLAFASVDFRQLWPFVENAARPLASNALQKRLTCGQHPRFLPHARKQKTHPSARPWVTVVFRLADQRNIQVSADGFKRGTTKTSRCCGCSETRARIGVKKSVFHGLVQNIRRIKGSRHIDDVRIPIVPACEPFDTRGSPRRTPCALVYNTALLGKLPCVCAQSR